MEKNYFEDLKNYDFKNLLEDIGVKIDIEQDLNFKYKIKFKSADGETLRAFTTGSLTKKYKNGFTSGVKKQELETLINDNSKYLNKSLRSNLYIAWYDLAIVEKNKPEHTNILLSQEKRRIETYKEIDNLIYKELETNLNLKKEEKLLNIVKTGSITGSIQNGKQLNSLYDTTLFKDCETYFEIPISKIDNKSLFLLEDYESATEYRAFIGVKLNGIFSMKEDISFSKEDDYLNANSINNAIKSDCIDSPEIKKKVKLKM